MSFGFLASPRLSLSNIRTPSALGRLTLASCSGLRTLLDSKSHHISICVAAIAHNWLGVRCVTLFRWFTVFRLLGVLNLKKKNYYFVRGFFKPQKNGCVQEVK